MARKAATTIAAIYLATILASVAAVVTTTAAIAICQNDRCLVKGENLAWRITLVGCNSITNQLRLKHCDFISTK